MLGLSLTLDARLQHRLTHAQRTELRSLLTITQKLRHPEIPDCKRGMEGLTYAHEALRDAGARGLLVGGLSEHVWSQRRTPAQLETHKDVDVLVYDAAFQPQPFEGGIDWWLARTGDVRELGYDGSWNTINRTWYENGNGVVLTFGVEPRENLEPGLHIPSPSWVIGMRLAETNALLGEKAASVDDEVIDAFDAHYRRRIRTRLPKFLREAFDGYILDEHYGGSETAIAVLEHDKPTLSAINTYLER